MDINYKNYHRDASYIESEKLFKNIFTKRFNIISKYIKNPRKVLDIGCSNGVFLDLYKDRETWGVEPSKNSKVAIAKKHKVLKTTFEKAILPQNYFDLVIMNHTLEHVKNAELVLNKIYKILKSNGILFIDVPNAGSLASIILKDKWPYRLPDEHNYQFTKKTLSKMVKNAQFKILHWESRSGFFEYANPFLELTRLRFWLSLIFFPYDILVTFLNMGDSMSFIGKKI